MFVETLDAKSLLLSTGLNLGTSFSEYSEVTVGFKSISNLSTKLGQIPSMIGRLPHLSSDFIHLKSKF